MNEDMNNNNNMNKVNNNANNNVNKIANNSVTNTENNEVVTDVNQQKNIDPNNRLLQFENREVDENPNGITSTDYPNGDHREETAAEFAPTPGLIGERSFADADEETEDGHAAEGRGVGAFAIVLSIISLFFLPVILGAAGIIVGFIARRNKATALGNSAIGIGAISIILTLFFSPFF